MIGLTDGARFVQFVRLLGLFGVTIWQLTQPAALRVVLLVIAALLSLLMPHRGRNLGSVLAVLYAAAIISFLWTGHGSAGAGAVAVLHAFADALHLLCAATWMGALLMLSAMAAQAARTPTPTKNSTLSEGTLHFPACFIYTDTAQ
ncbi:MAG TPA: hypothetical protein VMB48_11005 [Steroidobacteraceae bacterium]|nr:hypothetical protein [Steroidobacteraceae bacterium]